MLKEEKELLLYAETMHTRSINANYRGLRKRVRALVRAVREDVIEVYHDWGCRPPTERVLTFPDAVRQNKRWRKAK